MSVRFSYDWLDASGSADPVCAATMSSFRIDVNGEVVTRVEDMDEGSRHDDVSVPLFQVADWLVANWFFLQHNYSEGEGAHAAEKFVRRHDLRFAGAGYVLPRLTFIPSGRRVQLRWIAYDAGHARLRYLNSGQGETTVADMEHQFRRLIDGVIERMRRLLPSHEFTRTLSADWSAIADLSSDERDFCAAAATAGLYPFDVDGKKSRDLIAFCEEVEPSVRDDALSVSSGVLLSEVASWLNHATAALDDGTAVQEDDSRPWLDVRRAVRNDVSGSFHQEPWREGYALARAFRSHLGGNGGRIDLNRLDGNGLTVSCQKVPAPSDRIEGLVGGTTPACLVTRPNRGTTSTRFLVARALGDFLGGPPSGYGLLSTLRTDRQARSRAFAAEFLAPSESLRRRVGRSKIPVGLVEDLGDKFLVSTEVIRRQLENHQIAEVDAR